jgi:hypothetical protein
MKTIILISVLALSAIAIYKLAGQIGNLPFDLEEDIDDELKDL